MTLSTSCRLFGISRQAIYKQEVCYRKKQLGWGKVKALVNFERMTMPRVGTRKLYRMIKHEFVSNGIKIGRDGLFDCLRSAHMLIRPKKNYTKTTWSKHWLYKHPNLVKNLVISRPEQLWVSDITYVKTKNHGCYLSLITDAFSRKIMGYYVSEDLKTEGVLEALKMAVSDRVYRDGLIHHSDRGIQYCAEPYQQLLNAQHIRCSMTDGYDCYQNALAERINGILKNEFLVQLPADIHELKIMVKQSIQTYNTRRLHLSLNMKTPEQVHRQTVN